MKNTITVAGNFGQDIEMSKEDYVKQWVDHATQLHSVLPYTRAKRIITEVKNAAGREFDTLLIRQSHKAAQG